MKRCPSCDTVKDHSEFRLSRTRKDGLQTECKACGNARAKLYYQTSEKRRAASGARATATRKRARQWLKDYLTEHPCVDCGEGDTDVLDFDHVRGTKEFNLGNAPSEGRSVQRMLTEIAKCDVRCANCHRRITRRRERELGAP